MAVSLQAANRIEVLHIVSKIPHLLQEARYRLPLAQGPYAEFVCRIGLNSCKDGGDGDALCCALIALDRHHWQQPEAIGEHLQTPFQRPGHRSMLLLLQRYASDWCFVPVIAVRLLCTTFML